jgi:hypothetical protein
VQSAVDPPGRDAVPIFKPADGECSVVAHAEGCHVNWAT